ncbi:MAG: thiamine phosphate synthase [Proteobacteria bacterium]|nr:thiamine phosphate synthase [Pseudomonadota bacterium]
MLGPVLETPSHPGMKPLGWEGFRELASNAALPVYAIGGLTLRELETGRNHGAHGVAMIRGSWVGEE